MSDSKISSPDGTSGEEMVKVIDRKGRKKVIPRSEYKHKNRVGKEKESPGLSIRSFLSLAVILFIMIGAVYLALQIVK